MSFTGETGTFLNIAYRIRNSTVFTGRISALGNTIIATHLCIKRRVGVWILFMRGAWQLVFPEILFQNATRSNLLKALLGSKEQRLEKPRAKLKSLQEKKNSWLKNLKRIPPFSETRVERNSSVSKYEPGSLISQKFSQPPAWKISGNSSSIPVLLRRSSSNTRVCSNSFSLS